MIAYASAVNDFKDKKINNILKFMTFKKNKLQFEVFYM